MALALALALALAKLIEDIATGQVLDGKDGAVVKRVQTGTNCCGY
jgi:hypothetical protein